MMRTSLKWWERTMASPVPHEPDPRMTALVDGDDMWLGFIFRGEFVFFSCDEVFDVRSVFPDSHDGDESGEYE